MVIVQVAGLGFHSRTILRGLRDICWKCPFHILTTTRAMFDFCLVFGDFQTHWWHIEYLALLIILRLQSLPDPSGNVDSL